MDHSLIAVLSMIYMVVLILVMYHRTIEGSE